MREKLELAAFALPPSFPQEYVPEAVARFVKTCQPGMSKGELLRLTRARGWRPSWKPQAHLNRDGLDAFGFGLTIDGVGVSLIARMRRIEMVARASVGPSHDPRQMSLFE
jgi:hypothetical protein